MEQMIETDYEVVDDLITLRECLLALGYIESDQEETKQIVNQFLTDLLSATKSTGSLFMFSQRFPNYENMEEAIIRTASENAKDARQEQQDLFRSL